MKQIFFKTVRKDGGSVWAVGKYRQIYEVGKRYVFDPALPAHVFGMNENTESKPYISLYRVSPHACREFPVQSLNDQQLIYRKRAESSGTRVLIGYGQVRNARVPYCHIGSHWDFRNLCSTTQWVCDDFTIIGEIRGDSEWLHDNGERTEFKVIHDFDRDAYSFKNFKGYY